MASPRNRRHIIVPGDPTVERYSPHPRKIDVKKPPAPASRPAHGAALKQSFEDAASKGAERRQEAEDAGIKVHGAVPGLYVEFESRPGVRLKLSSLEDARAGIELVAVTETKTDEAEPKRVQHATVFVPDGKVKHFVSRFEKYAQTAPKKKGERRHEEMIDPVATLRLATLRGLWTDAPDAYPAENECIWWEVWLRRHDGNELSRLMEFASLQKLDVSERRLQFDERIVTLVKATPNELASSIDVLNDVAEVQRAKETAAVFVDMGPDEQADWAKELLARVASPGGDAPAACILDTGVNRGHPLLEIAVAAEDCTAVDPTWGHHDDGGGPDMMGHGTQMAGLVLYGDLTPVLAGSEPVQLQHRLESVKILPPNGANPPEVYGTITAEAASRVEVQAPDRARCFAMAVTATDERDRGKPTSWSSAVDALAAGRVFDQTTQGLVYLDDDSEDHHRRLFIVSAGNVDGNSLAVAHLDQSDTDPVHDPAQAWNALTVGAFTERISIQDASWQGWKPVAEAGDLSPWSTTSVTFAKQWPLKPDVVFEGGNVVRNHKDEVDFPCADLCLLSTHYKPGEKPFVVSYATSAATAQAARMAATIQAQYPDLWPEAVRGLIVHSAEWTRAMQGHLRGAGGKREREMLVRRYGFGVPRLSRALRSASDSLTLIARVLPVTVEVLFGGLPATKVSVRDDPANPPDGTITTCLSPPQAPGTVDVALRNLDDDGNPIAGEEVTLAAAFTYQRASLTRESELTRLVRMLLRSLKAQVLENLSLTVHTDFDDSTGDQLHVAAVSKLPALVIVGPELDENRFYSVNELAEDGGGDAVGLPFTLRRVPYTVDLTFQLVGMSEHTVELLNLMRLCTTYFHKNKLLEMDRDPDDPSKGRVAYEMDFVAGGQFKVESRPSDSNVRHFAGTFVIRGFDIDEPDGVVIDEGRTNDPVSLGAEQTGAS